MLLNPFRFGGAASFGLDAFTANLWGAYSISKLLSASTDALTAVNTTSSASATIGFSGASLDTAALASLAGSDSAVVSEFINQEGTTARNFGQATAGNRPRIVDSGVYDGKLVFDGFSDSMVSGANSGTPTGFTVFIRGLQRNTGTQILIEHSTNYNSNNSMVSYYDGGSLSVGVHDQGSSGVARSDFSGQYPNNNVQAWRGDRTSPGGGLVNVAALFSNGLRQSRTGSGDAGSIGGIFSAHPWYLAARAGASLWASLDLHTLVIYESAQSDANVAAISSIIAALP